jgi:hypothetical protein
MKANTLQKPTLLWLHASGIVPKLGQRFGDASVGMFLASRRP